jgi:hypothetical protein
LKHMASKKYKCPYCGKEFTKERTLQVHMCEPKRRYLQKDEKWVVNAFMVFQRFYQIHQKNSKTKTYDDFVGSPYYNAFVKFGRFIMHINPLYPDKYIDFVLKSKVKLDHWARDDLYETYLIETIITTMMDWATEQNAQWSDYFRLVNTNRAVQHIQQGKISPWLLLGCNAGKRMLKSFSDEQLQMIERFINPSFWPSKLKSYPADHMLVQDTAKEAKIV